MGQQEFINEVIQLTNEFRAEYDLQPLGLNLDLAEAAQEHSDNMASQDFFSHTGADGSQPGDRVLDAGYPTSYVWENIGAGYTTPEAVVQGWIDSPGHRANMLNAEINVIGVGYAYLANDTGSINYNHYWTQVFGQSSDVSIPDDTTIPDDPTDPDDTTIPDDPTTPDDTTIPDDPTAPDDPSDPDDSHNSNSTVFIEQVIQLTNEFRAENGLAPLTFNIDLTEAAQEHTNNMANQDFFDHMGLDGSQVWDRAATAGYDYTYIGENIATGSTTPAEVVQGWIDSPGHRANMLNPNFEDIGIGYIYLENDPGEWTYNYYWTQVFGQASESYIPPEVDLPDDSDDNSDDDSEDADPGDRQRIQGSNKNDKMTGSDTPDLILGGQGHDKLDGKDGDDLLKGQSGKDKLKGGIDDDTLLGGKDSDRLVGQADDDILKGGTGDDTLKGGTGEDHLYAQGNGGNGDLLIGQQGADIYYLSTKAFCTIRGFSVTSSDTLQLPGNVSEVITTQVGSDVQLMVGNTLLAIVENVSVDAVSDGMVF